MKDWLNKVNLLHFLELEQVANCMFNPVSEYNIPSWDIVYLACKKSSAMYSKIFFDDDNLALGVRELVVFTYDCCDINPRPLAFSFALMEWGEVKVAKHKIGECPFRSYE
ncbi:MAG: hypothetical protein ACOC5T_03970 [Elusimicrobiota bacterium]